MAALEADLDALAAQDLKGMFGPQVLERLGRLVRASNRLTAQLTRHVREGELTQAAEHDGKKTMQSWLRGHALLAPAAAGQLVRTGRALELLPAVAAGFAAGAITADAVAVIAPITRPEHVAAAAAAGVDLAGVDRVLAEVAASQQPGELAQVVQRYLAHLDPDGPEPDPTEGRSLSIVQHADGSVSGRFELDAVAGERVQAALESIVQANRPLGDGRSRAQQQADALVQLADNALAAGDLPILRTAKPQVAVTIDIDDLVDPATGPAAGRMGFGALISAARARMLACDGDITRIVFGPDGAPLDYGRSHRVVPKALRRAVEHRDRSCVFAGCGAPTHWCDVHHLVHWADGGDTNLENSALLCERHHTKVHHGFRVERPPDGRWRTYRPDGTEILIGQPLLI
ncbi:HNH endonuclease [Blastococcus sp. PRF04-17]|nr:HNH endonuclease signature motif containing protein [Blastococcus sp. PRF04-17]UOY04072.1 HNH endonuclease [Blastococcus sp. PRF04-17]